MIARVLEVDVAPDRMDDLVEAYREVVRPIHADAKGLPLMRTSVATLSASKASGLASPSRWASGVSVSIPCVVTAWILPVNDPSGRSSGCRR